MKLEMNSRIMNFVLNWDSFFFGLCSILKRNSIVESLDFGTDVSSQLEFVDLQYNEITDYKPSANKVLQVMYVSLSLIKHDFYLSQSTA